MFLYDLGSLLGKCKPDLRGEMLSTNQHGNLSTLCKALQSVLFIASLNTAAVTESAGRCGLFMRQICLPAGNDKGNIVCCLCTDWKDCSCSICQWRNQEFCSGGWGFNKFS